MAIDKNGGAVSGEAHPPNSVRDVHDAAQYPEFPSDRSDKHAHADIAHGESVPASDAPSHASADRAGPARSSMSNATTEGVISNERDEQAATAEKPVHLNDVEASGGRKVGTMRYVLAISLVAIVLIFALLLLLNR